MEQAKNGHFYFERIRSNLTEALFAVLATLFFVLFFWQNNSTLKIVFLCLSLVFLFYTINYRTLLIRLTHEKLQLRFGIFTWTVPLENIADCRLDDVSAPMRYGGAGIHFMLIKGRYRVSFNFLEHPRVVIALKTKQGLVRDVSFSTQQPEEIVNLITKPAIKLLYKGEEPTP